MSLFWNSIFEQSSYSELKIKKKKKFWSSSSIQETQVPCIVLEFIELEFLEKIQVKLEF